MQHLQSDTGYVGNVSPVQFDFAFVHYFSEMWCKS